MPRDRISTRKPKEGKNGSIEPTMVEATERRFRRGSHREPLARRLRGLERYDLRSVDSVRLQPAEGDPGGQLVFSDWESVDDLNVLSTSAATTQEVASGPIWAALWVFDAQNK